MSRLEDQFERFFEELWDERGWTPFSWQTELAARVNRGGWPEGLDLPTGSGKTACLEIALFTLACQAERSPQERTAPRRVFFVIDRRVVVDQVVHRAQAVKERLRRASNGVLHEVAGRLQSLGGGSRSPITVHQMRGGSPRDLDWVGDPAQPAIIASTVDQTGSRLLFRPYGSSPRSAPVHAGLVGNDSLILLDEAHCSVPFLETARAVARYRSWGTPAVATPFRFVVLSATLPGEISSEARFSLDSSTLESEGADELLSKRVLARKPTRLVVARGAKGKRAQEHLAKAIADESVKLAEERRAIGIMVNRVRTARLVRDRLVALPESDTILLTGRMRPLDRNDLLETHKEEFAASTDRRELERPTFFVATQCLEVGADLDFEGLVTECSSLDSLRQRFGRLDRLGERPNAEGVIVVQEGQAKQSDDDPVYGAALTETWQFLQEQSEGDEIDMGIESLRSRTEGLQASDPERWESLKAPTSRAPTLLPGHLDYWVQTSPIPEPDPEPAPFLHGVDHSAPEVSLAWRADLREDDPGSWSRTVALCSPTAPELMPVPLWAVGRWLRDEPTAVGEALSDVEGAEAGDDSSSKRGVRRLLAWRGPENSEIIDDPREIRPGEILLAPVSAGGWDLFGHIHPDTRIPARVDRGDEAFQQAKGRAILRLHPQLLALPERDPLRLLAESVQSSEDEEAALENLREAWDKLSSQENELPIPGWLKIAADTLVGTDRRPDLVTPHPRGGCVLSSRRPLVVTEDGLAPDDETTAEEAGTSTASEPITLERHLKEVAEEAERIARTLGCPDALVRDLSLAGRVHDAGKADSRFQVLLHGGDELRAAAWPLLAKSPGVPFTLGEYQRARARAGLPVGFRHEALSLRLFESTPRWSGEAKDPELVRFLISTHHGKCRPFLPVFDDEVEVETEIDGTPVTFEGRLELAAVDSGVGGRFWSLVDRFGWWGLAWIESILRTADWQVSARESGRTNP